MTTATITSNGVPIPHTSHYFAELTVSDTFLDAATLRARYQQDGYVLLRRFPSDFCKDGDTRAGRFTGTLPIGLPGHGLKGHPAYEFVRTDAFRAFAEQPKLQKIAEIFFGAPAARIRRTPLLHFTPGRKVASRAHMDRTYIDGVAADVVTMWVPLDDCPLEAGGLLYLEGSHEDAALEDKVRTSAAPSDRAKDSRPLTHDLKWIADQTQRRWLTTNYKAGDIVVHSPAIVHASTDPGATDYMRISTDIRFHRADSAVDPRWTSDWSSDDGY